MGLRSRLKEYLAGRDLARRRAAGYRIVHYLHIGKTGGTALQAALRASNEEKSGTVYFVDHRHGFRLEDVPHGDFCLFAVRNPVDRFVSGFYSRKRQGAPRLLVPHSPGEATAFARFPEAHILAEGLDDEDAEVRSAAHAAMAEIGHVNTSFWDWFGDEEALVAQREKIVAVLRQVELDADGRSMAAALGLENFPLLPRDPVKAHKNDYSGVAALSKRAEANLRTWYARDLAFIDFVEEQFGLPYFADWASDDT